MGLKIRAPWDKKGKPRSPFSGGVPNPADIPNQVKNEVAKIVPDEVEKALKQGIEAALQEFFDLAGKGILGKLFRIMRAAAPNTFWGPTLGMVSFTISDVPSKLSKLEHWGRHPPTSKDALKRMVLDLDPDTVEITIKIQVPGIPSASTGGTLVYNTDTFLKRIDTLWDEIKP